MRQQKINATFYVLGKTLQARVDISSASSLQTLYKQQCVGVQGWEYRSHAHWVDWQDSVTRSAALVQQVLPDNFVPLFRPPYGHRRADSAGFFRDQQIRVALWNIDSQDSAGQLDAEQTSQRVLTLMLLWRKGTVVFHDSQKIAQQAVPWLMANTAQSGVIWEDCHIYPQQLSDESDEAEPESDAPDEQEDESSESQPQEQTDQAERPAEQREE
jgi:peptidoglycan/xylan/chitin deacetylase (PgdA/CDA1 family)